MSPTHMCRAQCGWWVHPTHSGVVLAPTPPQAAPGASALPAACPGSRFNPSQGPAALPSIPSIVSSDLELAGRCLLYPSPFFLCTESGFLCVFRVLSSTLHRGSCPGLQRKKRILLRWCQSGREPLPALVTPSPTPQHSRAWRTLSFQGLFQVRLLQPIFGKQGAAW